MMGLFVKSPDGTQEVELTQEQIDVITPLFNQRISSKKINQACLDALERAGVPAQFETKPNRRTHHD